MSLWIEINPQVLMTCAAGVFTVAGVWLVVRGLRKTMPRRTDA